MRGDEILTLGDEVHIVSGFAFDASKFNESRGIDLIRIRDIESDSTTMKFTGTYDARFVVNPGDVLVGMDGEFKVARWAGSEALLNQRVCKVATRPGSKVLQDYLFYMIAPELDLIHRRTPQTTVRHLSTRVLENLSRRFPPLPEQRRIAEILDTLDEAIRKTEQVIAKLQQVKQGLLHDLLTRGIDENGELRDPERHPEQFKDSELGRIPREWEVGALGSVLDRIEAGKSPSLEDTPAKPGQWGVLKVSAVRPDGFKSVENKVVHNLAHIVPTYEVHDGDLLITRANTSELVGLTCLVREPQERLLLCDKTLRLVVATTMDLQFVFIASQMNSFRRQVESRATGSSGSMKNISQAAIRSLRVPIPGLPEQKRICSVLTRTGSALERETGALSKLHTLKQGLMDDLLTGRVRVPVNHEDAPW